jgi:hypothetical protein
MLMNELISQVIRSSAMISWYEVYADYKNWEFGNK